MNAERLHAIANALKAELAETNSPALLRALVDGLQGADPQAIANARDQVEAALRKAPSNEFSPAWRQAVEELGVARLLGDGLLAQVRSILERQELTLPAAAADLAPLADELERLDQALDSLKGGL